MNNWFMILLGWLVVLGALAAYAASVVRRGRTLGRTVADTDKPWL